MSTLPAYLNALEGKGVHVVTVNDYLAARDAAWMGDVHEFLGLEVGVVLNSLKPEERRAEYAKDITYVTNNEPVSYTHLGDEDRAASGEAHDCSDGDDGAYLCVE